MATTSQGSDFDRVTRWGKEFLAAGEAGTGGATGRSRRRSDATAGPPGDALWPVWRGAVFHAVIQDDAAVVVSDLGFEPELDGPVDAPLADRPGMRIV